MISKSNLLGALIFFTWSGAAQAALITGSTLNFVGLDGSVDTSSIPVDGNGSWFGVQPASFGVVSVSSFEGLVVGSTQTASGSHSGVPDGSESPSIDNPHYFYGNTGMLGSVSATNILSASGNTASLDFTGITWGWAGTDNISLYEPSLGDTGVASIVCAVDCSAGDSYVLNYLGHVELGGPQGFGGEEVRIHFEGTISAVPVPAAIWLFSSGFLALAGLVRKK